MTSTSGGAAGEEHAGAPDHRPYPLALRVAGRPCLVVGGGGVAARKVGGLLACGALVEVISPLLGDELQQARRDGSAFRWLARAFQPGDTEGCLLVVAATDDRSVNQMVAEDARSRGALVNVVDDPEGSDFFVPSVLRRGALQFAVTTGGLSPALSASVRRRLETLFPEEWGEALSLLGEARAEARRRGLGEAERRELARRLAALDIEALLAEGGTARVKEAVEACTSPSWE